MSTTNGEVPAGEVVETVVARVRAWMVSQAILPSLPLVVGCSGGADSTTLLGALARCGYGPLYAVYVDHGLRAGTEAEAEVVAENAARLVAAGARVSAEVIAVAVERRGNRMAAARTARYRALAAAARRHGSSLVAVGHTASDQAETVAFRALRGDPPIALAGMPERRSLEEGIELLRPLLGVERAETAAFAAAMGLAVTQDPTNERLEFTRARIRRGLAVDVATQAQLLALAATTSEWVDRCEAAARALGDPSDVDVARVAASGPDVARCLLRRAGVHRAGDAHVRALLRLVARAEGSQTIDLGGGLVAERRYGRLRIGPPTAPDPGNLSVPIEHPGRYSWLGRSVEVSLGDGPGDPVVIDGVASPGEHCAELPQGLHLRNLLPGDRLRTRVGRRKLHDMLTDAKLARDERRRLPILVRGDDVLWVGGVVPRGLSGSPGGGIAVFTGASPDVPPTLSIACFSDGEAG